MKKKKAIQLNTIDLGGGTTKGCNCEELDLSGYAKKEDVPTKVSQLENDSEFVKSTSLGTAAYKNVEDLQSGGNTCLKLRHNVNGSILYEHLSSFYNKKVRFWQAQIFVQGTYSISIELGEAGSKVVTEGETEAGRGTSFLVVQERIANIPKIEIISITSGEVIYTDFSIDLTGISISSSSSYKVVHVYY